MRRILLALALALGVTVVPAPFTVDSAGANNCPYGWVLYGEFQNVPNLTPPCRLDRGMYNGTWNGLSVAQRCANLGGTLVWQSGQYVCRDTDY